LAADYQTEVGVLDAAGHRTYLLLIVPYLELTMGTNQVLGRASPLTSVQLRLTDAGTLVGQADLTNSAINDFATALQDVGGAQALILTGRRLTLVEPRSGTTTVDIPVLTIELDAIAHEIRGTGPAGVNVPLRLYPPGRDPVDRQTRSDANGNWSIDDADLPRDAGFTIGDLTRADARLVVGNGHTVVAIAVPPGQPTPIPGSPTPTRPAVPTPTRTEVPSGIHIFLPSNMKNSR
jgi:hypothetical protein